MGAIGYHQALVTRDVDCVCVCDLDERYRLVEFDKGGDTEPGEEALVAFALADLGGRRPRLVAIGEYGSLVLGDVESGEWDEPVVLRGPLGGDWLVLTGARLTAGPVAQSSQRRVASARSSGLLLKAMAASGACRRTRLTTFSNSSSSGSYVRMPAPITTHP